MMNIPVNRGVDNIMIMKDKLFAIMAVMFFSFFPGIGWAIENPAIRSSLDLRLLPPGNVRSGLVRSPNPIDTSGNLVITGNIRGGRHFRGIVPYRADSYFGAVTGSSELDSFLRHSAGSEDFGRYTGTYGPFYSFSRMVTTTRPGQAGVIRPPTMRIGDHTVGYDVTGTLLPLSKGQTLSRQGSVTLGSGFGSPRFAGSQIQENMFWVPAGSRGMETRRPMSMTPQEIERAILAEVDTGIYRDKNEMPARKETTAQQETRMEQLRWELEGVEKKDAELEKDLTGQDESLRLRSSETEQADVQQPFELQRLRGQPAEGEQQGLERDSEQGTGLDVYGQMRQKIDELQKSYEQLVAAEAAKAASKVAKTKGVREGSHFAVSSKIGTESKEAVDGEKWPSEKDSGFVGLVPPISGETRFSQTQKDMFGVPAKSRRMEFSRSGVGAIRSKVQTSDEVDLSARAKAILGAYRSFESFANDKFNQHLAIGEKYLQQGKYYRSADAYTLALIYKPQEPLAYTGKGHALFAAGEYMSSALFLSRAITAGSEGRGTKDYGIPQFLALGSKLLGFIDRDRLENRVVDVEQWQQRNSSAELQFLLGYIYYQMGRLDAALEAIDEAYEKMPEAPAVIALKKVVESKRQPHQDKSP
jgi:tetratricopeptide (TPR) repeat protein